MYREIQVGRGLRVTVCHLPVVLTTEEEAQFAVWRDEVYSAIGLVVSLLDERVAQREILEDFVIVDGHEIVGLADARLRVRNFLPHEIGETELASLASLASNASPEILAAARSYLRAAQLGPRADAITLFWIALETLVGTEQVTRRVEEALREAGEDPTALNPTVGRLWGLRADVVHQGLTEPDLLAEGWYGLETICRALIRSTLGLESRWPFYPGETGAFPTSIRRRIERSHRFPRTVWHEPS